MLDKDVVALVLNKSIYRKASNADGVPSADCIPKQIIIKNGAYLNWENNYALGEQKISCNGIAQGYYENKKPFLFLSSASIKCTSYPDGDFLNNWKIPAGSIKEFIY